MTSNRLQDDLIKDFKEQRRVIYEQVELLDPLASSLRKPAAQRLISKGALIFAEIICYLLAIGVVGLAIFMDKIYPFYVLSEIRYKSDFKKLLGWVNIEAFNISIYVLFGIIVLLLYILARAARGFRLKNDILNLAGKNIKIVIGQHLTRKAAIDTIEQRHFKELPNEHLEEGVKVNEVPNPGYDGE